jgi:hypothetical protein
MSANGFIGRSPDSLSRKEKVRLSGLWIATELYSPETTPLRLIEAVGTSPAECVRMLRERGLDPRKFEMTPYQLS